ncbi:MAG: type II secretion system F family protein, partial [Methanobacteriaceae archaeon]|nr:type II secretion system F family protein [Methanobacteriaceae archaeon]
KSNSKYNSNSNKSKFDLNSFKSLFFNEDFQEELIFESLENKSSKIKDKQVFGFLFNKNKKSTLSSSDFNKLSNSQETDGFNEFLNNKLLFNLKSLSKFGIYFIIVLLIVIVLIGYFISLEVSLIILVSISLVFLTIIYMPKMKMQNNSVYFSRELPYALRQLATELKSGKSLFNALESVVQADYGILSIEFSRVLEEIKYGETTEDAFIHLENRIKSDALSRVIREILSTLRIGGNLANSLSIIAEDINFEMRMKLKDYAQRLNAFIMIYTFIAILAPVVLLTLLLAASTVMGDFVPGDLLLVLYGVFFPMLIVFLGFMIKKLEPKI